MSDAKAKSMDELIVALRQKREQVKLGGGAERLAKQREQGKLTARERIDAIIDPTSLEEFGLFAQHRQTQFGMADKDCPADGVVTGAASVDGRLVHLGKPGFHRARRLCRRSPLAQSRRRHGVAAQDRQPVRLHQRLRRRARAGRHRLALRLRPGVLPQRDAVRASCRKSR